MRVKWGGGLLVGVFLAGWIFCADAGASVCGNNVTEPGEACDGTDLNGFTCATVAAGFVSGALKCKADCSGYDVSECVVGNTASAAGCSQADVQAAVDNAQNGDTVLIPAGRCTWSAPVTIGKSITLKGAGVTKTIITAAVNAALTIQTSSSPVNQPVDVSQIQFTDAGVSTSISVDTIVGVTGTGLNWRIHDLLFTTSGLPTREIRTGGSTYGLIDRNVIDGTTPSEFVTVEDSDWSSWQRPINWGTANAVYVESNTVAWTGHWEGRPALDGELGGRVVFRYNSLTNAMIGNHGLDSGVGTSMLQMEIYNNALTITNSMQTWARLGLVRGGTGVWFNNTANIGSGVWLGSSGNDGQINLAVFRDSTVINQGFGNNSWPVCNGTAYKICSNVDKNWNLLANTWQPVACTQDSDCSNVPGANGATYSCAYKFCSQNKMSLCTQDSDCPNYAGGETCGGYLDGNSPSGYPCAQQPGYGAENNLTPIYAWNNTATGGQGSGSARFALTADADPNTVVANRDYFDNTPKPGYVPYVYPHPLAALGGSTGPAGPTATPPDITSTLTATAVDGRAFRYQIKAAHSPSSFTVTGLPEGLSVNAKTGLISGIPLSSGTMDITLFAFNAGGFGQSTLVLTIDPEPPVLASIALSPAAASMEGGDTQQFSATAYDQYGNAMTKVRPAYRVEESSVAEINADGLAKGRRPGVAVIKAVSGKITSNLALLSVTDTTPPMVSIVSPVNGATIARNGVVRVLARDNVEVVMVQLYADSVLVATSTAKGASRLDSFGLGREDLSNGLHTLTAEAFDEEGNESTFASVTVTVKNPSIIALGALRIETGGLQDALVSVVPRTDQKPAKGLHLSLSLKQELLFSDQVDHAAIFDLGGRQVAAQQGGGLLDLNVKPGRYLIQVYDNQRRASVLALSVAR